MPVLRFSVAPNSNPADQTAHWHLFAEPNSLKSRCHEAGKLLDVVLGQVDPDRGNGEMDPDPNIGQAIFANASSARTHFKELQEADVGPADQPIVIFVHGFQFEPRRTRINFEDSDNPHQRLYHFDEVEAGRGKSSGRREHDLHLSPWFKRAMSPDGQSVDPAGLAIGFGYSSWGDASKDPTASFREWADGIFDFDVTLGGIKNFYALAYVDAGLAGHGLAGVISQLSRRLDELGQPNRKIDIVAHSLGTRTTMKALETLAARAPGGDRAFNRMDRVICLAGACLWVQAARTLDTIERLGGGHRPQIYNVLSSDDGVVSILGARAALDVARAEAGIDPGLFRRVLAFIEGGAALGREGLPDPDLYGDPDAHYANWVDINLADRGVQKWALNQPEGPFELRGNLGFRRGDHWVHFTHRKNWDFYRQILWDRDNPNFTAAGLRAAIDGL